MKRRVTAALLCCAGLALVACSSNSGEPTHAQQVWAGLRDRFTSGQSQIRRAYDKKKTATSWRMRTEMRLHPGNPLVTDVEVSCPDREHITSTMGSDTFESIRIGSEAWVRERGGDWQPSPLPPNWSPCGDNPGLPSPWAMLNEGRDMTTVLAKLAEKSQVKRGELVQTEQGRCTEWKVSFGHPQAPNVKPRSGEGMYYSLCVGDDHYPVMAGLSGGGITNTYSDWNKPVRIDAPPVKPGTPAATPAPMQMPHNPHAGMFTAH